MTTARSSTSLLSAARLVVLQDRRARLKWLGLLLLALTVSVAEMATAAVMLVLLRLMTAPDTATELPVVASIRRHVPQWTDDRFVVATALTAGAFFAVRGCLASVQSFAQNKVAATTGAQLSAQLLRAYLRQPYQFHLRRNSSELIRTTNSSVADIVAYVLLPAVSLLSESLIVIGTLVVLVLSAPGATVLVVILLLPVIAAVSKVVQPRQARLGIRSQALNAENLAALRTALEGVRDISLFRREEYFLGRFVQSRAELAHVQYRRGVLTDLPRIAVETAVFLGLTSYMIIAVLRSADTTRTIPTLGLFAYAALRILPSLNRIVSARSYLKFGEAGLRLVADELGRLDSDAPGPDDESPLVLEEALACHDVSFAYEDGTVVLTDIDLTIQRGESIGIVGPTGAGKSTLADVLLGLLTPTSGHVTVDSEVLTGQERRWRASVALVPQTVFLADDSLRRNVAFGVQDSDIDDDRLREAIRSAQLEDFVSQLPGGLDTPVGEQGVLLSGGQRQRVAIARALYTQPAVLVFDEGTSALDNITESELIAAMQSLRGTRTVITIAHRLSTVVDCDRIIFLDQGRVLASGSYEDVMRDSPHFRKMARHQSH